MVGLGPPGSVGSLQVVRVPRGQGFDFQGVLMARRVLDATLDNNRKQTVRRIRADGTGDRDISRRLKVTSAAVLPSGWTPGRLPGAPDR
jgi:hypothetical protein